MQVSESAWEAASRGQITFRQQQCGELCVLERGGGDCNQIWGLECQAWGQERGLGKVHLSWEHQVSTRARAGQGEGWRGEDTGPGSPESWGQQDRTGR